MEKYEDTRLLVESFYDQQDVREETRNRLRTIVRNRLVKVNFTDVESKIDPKEKSRGKEWNDKEIMKKLDKAKEEKKLSEEDYEYLVSLMDIGKQLEKFENNYKKKIMYLVKDEPIYEDYLSKISGVAELTSANLIGYLGYCENFDTISKLWKYCGIGMRSVCKNCGKYCFTTETERKDWVKRHEERTIEKKKEVREGEEPISKDFNKYTCQCKKSEPINTIQKKVAGLVIDYNPKLKTLMYKISDCFIKQGKGYRKLYDQFKKAYQEQHPEIIESPKYKETKKGYKKLYTKMHIDLMARRKVEKIFLANYYLTARKIKGLPVRAPYPIEHLKHTTMIEPFTDE